MGLFSRGIGVSIIRFIQNLPYLDICDIKESLKKNLKLEKVIFSVQKYVFTAMQRNRLLLAKCLLIDGLAAIAGNMPLPLLCHWHVEFASESVIFPFVCAMRWKTYRTDAFILQCLLKRNINKACPEDETMPLVCLLPPTCADRAVFFLVVSVLVWTCDRQGAQMGPR